MPVYKANALVLRRIPLGESDKIVTLYSREFGKFNAIAKGARKTTSRLSGAAEPLMLLRALIAEGMNLDILTQCEVRESFPLIRADFDRYLRATYACELLDKVTGERDAAPESFDLLLSTLYILQRAEDPDATLHAYELQLMQQIGYEPNLYYCARCERAWGTDVEAAAFSAERGGALCEICARQTREETLPLSMPSLQLMRALLTEDDARSLARTVLPDGVRQEIAAVLKAHLRRRLERDVRSTEFLDALRLDALTVVAPQAITSKQETAGTESPV